MFGWSFIFLVLAIIAAVFGYQKPSSTFTTIAKLLFFVFLLVFFVYLLAGLFSSTPPHPATGLPAP